MKGFLQRIKSAPDYLALFLVLAVIIGSIFHYKFWNDPNHIIVHDVVLYYEYLPAAFIYKDLSMSFTEKDPEFFKNKIWTVDTEKGKTVSKMTMGMTLFYSPFFFSAHALAGPLGFPADGYSNPYRVALIISSVIFALSGLLILIHLLRKFFSRGVAAVTILVIGLGTNLYFYTTIDPAMSHAYSFFLFAAFILLTDKWIQKPSWLTTVFLGLTGGLIILIRPTNGIIFILVPLWYIDSVSALKNRFIFLLKNSNQVVLIAFIVLLVFLPQLLYWKYTTGSFFYYSYGEERFYFNDPEFLKGLFSYRKGWLVYTPVMVFALAGIVLLYQSHRRFFWPVMVFTLLNFYIIWSWWCWWYGGGFGQRALIESYALLSIPFAAFTQFILSRRSAIRTVFLALVLFLVLLNIFQTFQYTEGIIHWDGMTKKSYWDTYIRTKISPAHYEQIQVPDYEAALKGDR